ncbi:hypothetical protein K439DRAFT_1619678 [Ramaria rubella]|nr:hypothetical protein K439DRAFT_1619678 [Ramaria rubella]
MALSFSNILKKFQTKVLTEPNQCKELLEEIDMWVKEMEGIDLSFKIPAEVTKIRGDVEAVKLWLLTMKGGFKMASPNSLASPAVVLSSPHIDKQGSIDRQYVDELANDTVAIVLRKDVKLLGGVGIADTHCIVMPVEYGEGSAYHLAGVVYVNHQYLFLQQAFSMWLGMNLGLSHQVVRTFTLILTQSHSKSPPSTDDSTQDLTLTAASVVKDAQWPHADIVAFLDFLIDYKSEAGDGMSFKGTLWTRAAAHMVDHTSEGGVKTANACRSKWTQLKEVYQHVTALKNISGLTYHDNTGINCCGAESTWKVYAQAHPKTAKYGKHRFPHHDTLGVLLSPTPKGQHCQSKYRVAETSSTI